MTKKYQPKVSLRWRRFAVVASALLCCLSTANAAALLQNLQVEYRPTPLGIDVAQPRFSWQMATTAGERSAAQAAYQLEVRDPQGRLVWDTKKVDGSGSLGILYAGSALKAATRYSWTVTVWNQAGAKLLGSSWFETGLMDPSPSSSAWSGAQWIGGRNEDLVLYAPYLAIFDLKYALTIAPGSTRASFVYGANDSRLMDKNKNIYQLANGKDQGYIKLELDIAAVDGSPDGKAKLNVYRAGYKDTDTPAKPLKTFELAKELINSANRNSEHTIEFRSAFGQITISIDGQANLTGAPAPAAPAGPAQFGPGGRGGPANAVNLNPLGMGGNYLPFGMLCDIGFAVDPGQNASFRDLTVRNNRAPNNILFQEDLSAPVYKGIFAAPGVSVANGRYVLSGGTRGVFQVKDPSRNAMPMLRTTFKAPAKAVAGARLYVTARGIYEVFLNGRRVGDDYYNPGLTQYNVTHLYQTYDVTSLIRAGDNALGAMLGEGWWSGLLSFGNIWNHFGDRQSLLAKLVVTYKDGTSDTITSNDKTWKYFASGPVLYSSLDFGEIYDAARDQAVEGWTTAAYNDSKWKPAAAVPLQGTTFAGLEQGRMGAPGTPFQFDKLALLGQIGNNAGIFRTLTAKSMKEVRPGVFVYNMGQNLVGVPRITVANGRAGGRLTLRFSEMLYPDLKESGKNVGMLMTENYRAALNQDVYTMKAGSQVFQPRFTSHGYQYIEITGLDKPLPLEAIQGVAISSVRELTADYRTSSEKVNKLWSNLVWSNVDNFLTIPTDCPQRNERMGWSGDINVFSRTATYVSNANQFLTRHMYAMRDTQSAAGRFTDVAPVGGGFGGVLWGSAGIVVPWETYLQYKDTGLLAQHYPAMAAYIDYLETTLDPKTGLSSDGQLGDWLGPQNNLLGAPFLSTAYHAYDLGIMAQIAEILGKPADAAKYRTLYEKRKAFFNATFVNAEKKTLGTVGGRGGFGAPGRPPAPLEFKVADSQTSYAVGLAMGLFNSENTPHMVRNLADSVARGNQDDGGVLRPPNSLMTGFIGTSWINKALSDNGLSELSYRLLHNNQYPSWLYAIDQGATSIWERLNGYTVENGFGGNNSMNSFNHYSFGAVGQWMMAYSLGIQRDEPGFQKFILQPEPDPTGIMTSAEGYYDSMYGRIRSAWKVEAKTLTYKATVPANTTATLYLPASAAASVKEGGQPPSAAQGVEFKHFENGKAVYLLHSGSYEFTASR
ncbi:family 78 glycoside hydrolase catalytic domain [Paludibaculum fermentans]|uniref:family 78 glycoside hydrolase catalytic domain n=1 Tax=Paludibaculum fermentans TaxID=1473598 RepID=UPI003EBA13DE